MLRWHAVAANGPREEDRRVQAAEEGGERADGLTSDVKGIMDGLDKIVYLIEKERMVKEVNSRVSCKQDYRTMLTELPSLRDELNSHCVTN